MRFPCWAGSVKLQWKPDWAMRWAALNVDYEMYGKDLIPSAELGVRICRALGGRPPAGMAFELFLDEGGQKISKSKGTGGVTVDEWLSYALGGKSVCVHVSEAEDGEAAVMPRSFPKRWMSITSICVPIPARMRPRG